MLWVDLEHIAHECKHDEIGAYQLLRQLKRDFDYLATQDQMYYPAKDLQLTKLVTAVGPFPILELFPF
ncbi:MAG: hypothetical protein ACPG4U_05320 [Pseudomonadales bacterium]